MGALQAGVRPASIHFLWFVHVIEVFFPEYFSGPVFPEEKSRSGQFFLENFQKKNLINRSRVIFFKKFFRTISTHVRKYVSRCQPLLKNPGNIRFPGDTWAFEKRGSATPISSQKARFAKRAIFRKPRKTPGFHPGHLMCPFR
jgi:hypothetical protein